MIVDLVRNDLTRSAKPGSVKTEELFGIYSFTQVHQMISTVVCELEEGVSVVQAIKNTFPMGSMTGAPKINAMRLMEQYEQSRRGVYSGAIGYFNPDDDFDFNVVIRTLLYNKKSKYLSFQAGSAITWHADAEKEYEECLLKAQAILEALGRPLSSSQP
jgi:para-aminobenzoate synthetase component 1